VSGASLMRPLQWAHYPDLEMHRSYEGSSTAVVN
jgi:hypothetical protein